MSTSFASLRLFCNVDITTARNKCDIVDNGHPLPLIGRRARLYVVLYRLVATLLWHKYCEDVATFLVLVSNCSSARK